MLSNYVCVCVGTFAREDLIRAYDGSVTLDEDTLYDYEAEFTMGPGNDYNGHVSVTHTHTHVHTQTRDASKRQRALCRFHSERASRDQRAVIVEIGRVMCVCVCVCRCTLFCSVTMVAPRRSPCSAGTFDTHTHTRTHTEKHAPCLVMLCNSV